MWMCIGCRRMLDKSEYSTYLGKRNRKTKDGKTRCNTCMEAQECTREEMNRRSRAMVQIAADPRGAAT